MIHTNRAAAIVLAGIVASPLPATAAEYMEKTPFQLSRAFSPGVITEGGKIVWVAGQTATRDGEGRDIANSFEAQTKQVFGDRCSTDNPCSAEGMAKKK